mmetsp:Transcript_61/g.118  ORF Transcript_61/g.118 Transcript_61/m.118 type:complete len:630 (+) Transcript_61:3-1892(+)
MGLSVGKFSRTLRHQEAHRADLMQQARTTIAQSMEDFIVVELKSTVDAGKIYHRIGEELDSCRAKFAATPKAKEAECRDAGQLLKANEGVFYHAALNYAYQINVLLSREHAIIIERLLAYMNAVNTYYIRGADSMKDLEPTLRRCSQDMSEAAAKLKAEKRKMESENAAAELKLRRRPSIGIDEEAPPVLRQGYLFKRESRNAWAWQYFVLRGGELLCQPREVSGREEARGRRSVLQPMVPDLRLCTTHAEARGSIDRQFCFELITTHKKWVLQATSSKARDYWVAGINEAIESALNAGRRQTRGSLTSPDAASVSTPGPPSGAGGGRGPLDAPSPQAAKASAVRAVAGNGRCADCGAVDPVWCSINLGVTLCIECSGIHRGFGVHVSKVRSLQLDDMSDGVASVMRAIGNDISNDLYFGLIGRETAEGLRPKPEDDRSEKAEWIRQKYVDRAFMAPVEREVVEAGLLEAATSGNLVGCVTNCTSVAAIDCTPGGPGTDTPLLAAVKGGFVAVAEYLLLNGADVHIRAGPKVWSAVHIAASNGNVEMVSLLLKYKAAIDVPDADGNTPLQLAIQSASGDVVTMLRLASLNDGEQEWIGIAMSDFKAGASRTASNSASGQESPAESAAAP